jgi:tetratricopeptide (TPR) repeat protein
MARSTVFTYKDREVDPRQVGATLQVRAVVTGHVLRQGERLVIRAELVDVADGARLWGGQYERPLADIFTVQEEIAREISENLRLRLGGGQRRQLAKRYTSNTDAYQLYLRGRHQYLKFNRASQEKALAYFQEAVALDPNYALAYAGIADIYADFSSQYLPPGEAMPKAKEAALKALAIDDHLPEARHSLAMIKWFGDWDWAGAEREFKRALELNPNAGTSYAFYADFLLRMKRFDEALTAARRGFDLDPLAAYASEMVSKALIYLRRHDQSIAQSRKTLELYPDYVWAHSHIVFNLLLQDRYAEAGAELRQALKITRHDGVLSYLGYVEAVRGQVNEARRILDELETESRRRRVSPVYLARIYAGLGDKERALALLQQAYEERSDHLLSLSIDPVFDSLRSNPRFVELLRRVGLAP